MGLAQAHAASEEERVEPGTGRSRRHPACTGVGMFVRYANDELVERQRGVRAGRDDVHVRAEATVWLSRVRGCWHGTRLPWSVICTRFNGVFGHSHIQPRRPDTTIVRLSPSRVQPNAATLVATYT